jgi:hypothetical protein
MADSLKPLPEGAIIQLSSQQYNDLISRVLRIENFIMLHQRSVLLKELSHLEGTFGIPAAKEKRER